MFAKHHTPNSVRVVARRLMCEAHQARLRLTVDVRSHSEYPNIFHCAVRKTASQWIKALFNDPVVYRYSGLLPHDPRPYKWKHPQPFPSGRVVSTLFLSHKQFTAIPKPDGHRAFFVLRDPRDVVVSYYFSTRSSHTPMGDIPQVRRVLQERSREEGLRYVIDHLAGKGVFRAMRSWVTAPAGDGIRVVRYEDLIGERQREEVDRLFGHCGIHLPPPELTALLSRYSFSSMRGQPAGTETISHYRKGRPGDWRNHFDDDLYQAFDEATGDLVSLLGYPARDQPDAVPNGENRRSDARRVH
jgi:hypothetical protein